MKYIFWDWVLKYDLNERKTEILQRKIEKYMQSFAGKKCWFADLMHVSLFLWLWCYYLYILYIVWLTMYNLHLIQNSYYQIFMGPCYFGIL